MTKKANPKELAIALPPVADIMAAVVAEGKAAKLPWNAKGLLPAEKLGVRRYYVDLLRMDGRPPFAVSRLLGIPDQNVRRDFRDLEGEETVGELAKVRDQKRAEISKRLMRVIEKAEEHRVDALRGGGIKEANKALGVQLDALTQLEDIYGLKISKFEHTGADGGAIQLHTSDPRLSAALGKLDALGVTVETLLSGKGDARAREGG